MTPEQALVRTYQRAAKQLRHQITQAIASGNLGTQVYLEHQLNAVDRILNALRASTRKLTYAAAAYPYIHAAHAVDLALGLTGEAAFAFAGANHRAVATLARNMVVKYGEAIDTVGRRAEDAYRHAALEQIAHGIATGSTRRATSAALQQRLIREGVTDAVTGFVDRAGKRWQLDVYTRMVARTTTREAVSVGTAQRMGETGQQLITISDHATQTPICQQYEGNTYALPGTVVDGYETIDDMPPFHPNCQHVATPAEGNTERFLSALEQAPTRAEQEDLINASR